MHLTPWSITLSSLEINGPETVQPSWAAFYSHYRHCHPLLLLVSPRGRPKAERKWVLDICRSGFVILLKGALKLSCCSQCAVFSSTAVVFRGASQLIRRYVSFFPVKLVAFKFEPHFHGWALVESLFWPFSEQTHSTYEVGQLGVVKYKASVFCDALKVVSFLTSLNWEVFLVLCSLTYSRGPKCQTLQWTAVQYNTVITVKSIWHHTY